MKDVIGSGDVTDPGEPLEVGDRHIPNEPELDQVMGHVTQGIDPIDLGEEALADDRDPVA